MEDPNEQASVGELRLFVVRDGDTTTWVLAKNEDDVVAVLVENYIGDEPATPERLDADLGWENGRPSSIAPISRGVAHRTEMLDDDGGNPRSLLDEIAADPTRGIVCGTEV